MSPHRFSHEQLKGSLSPFKLVSFTFQVLESTEQFLQLSGVFGESDAVGFNLSLQSTATGIIRQQHALPVSHEFWHDMLVRRRILLNRVDMNAALVGERCVTHVWLVLVR